MNANSLFPHSLVRKNQDKLMIAVQRALGKKENLILNAPTGLGKTAAALAPALQYALKNKLTVFFLTSRHTQHRIAIDTLKKIQEAHEVNFKVADIIGRKWMCLQPGVETLANNDFNEFCKNLREDYKCEFYVKARKNTGIPTIEAEAALDQVASKPMHTDELIEACSNLGLCPYEIDLMLAKRADVIIADYYHLFNPSVRDGFFHKIEKKLSESIIIIDEAHNLPSRIRTLLSHNLSNLTLKRAIKEAKEVDRELVYPINQVQDVLNTVSEQIKGQGEVLAKRDSFMNAIDKIQPYDELIETLESAADQMRAKKKNIFLSSIANFLRAWKGPNEGFARIMQLEHDKQPILSLSYRCLDPSLVSQEVIQQAHSVIMMSGTLQPTKMYHDILGFNSAEQQSFENPFPKHNRLSIIVPTVTTKFSHRSKHQFAKIAKACADIANQVPGNTAIFFPSYDMRNQINTYFSEWCEKEILLEKPKLTQEGKASLIESFKQAKDKGAVLLGIIGASFSEGIDLPGDFLKCVVVVGLPLNPPDLETKELIKYYDHRFGKGWDYGYILPAITKTIQTAGRCIRSETDRGVICYLDYRYALPHYRKCFPRDWDLEITEEYEGEIATFFKKGP